MRKTVLVAATFLLATSVMCQTNFSGIWKLKDKKSLSGKLYSNAIPQQIKVSQTKDTLILETTEANLFPADIVGKEKNSLDGKATETTLGKKNRKRTVAVKFDKEGKKCTRTSSLYQEDGKSIYVTYTDNYSLEESNLIMQRKAENFSNGEVWEAWSVYQRENVQ